MQRASVSGKPSVLTCVMCGITRYNETTADTSWCYKCSTPMVTIV